MTPLPAVLPNRPQKIVESSGRAVTSALAAGRSVVLAYADCGSYGFDRYVMAEAERVAGMFGLPLTRVETGVSRLELELSALVKEAP